METRLYRRRWRCRGRWAARSGLQLVCPGREKGTGVTVSLQPRAGLLQGPGPEAQHSACSHLFLILAAGPVPAPREHLAPGVLATDPTAAVCGWPPPIPTPSPGQASLTQPRGAPPGQVCLCLLIPFSTGADGAHQGLLRRAGLSPQPGTTPCSVSLSCTCCSQPPPTPTPGRLSTSSTFSCKP